MLQEIYIKNFILIDELRLDFKAGLNVLSGETGAGKSIIVDALSLVLGERGSAELIKDHENKVIVEAVFSIDNNEKARLFLRDQLWLEDEESDIIIRREIAPNGKSTQRINQQNVNLSFIRQLTPLLLDMQLQHDNLRLLKAEQQLQVIDALLTEEPALPKEVRDMYQQLQTLQKELGRWQENEQNKRERIELLEHQIQEIRQAQLKPEEEAELLVLKKRIDNGQKLLASADKIEQCLYHNPKQHSAYDLLAAAIAAAGAVTDDAFFAGLHERLEELHYGLQDIMGTLSAFKDQIDFEPGLTDEVEDRLHVLQRLKNRYGSSVEDILAYLVDCEVELEELENTQAHMDHLLGAVAQYTQQLQEKAKHLTRAREKAATDLEKKVSRELAELNLPHLRFAVVVQPTEEIRASGKDQVYFMFSANPGEKMQPIVQVASGGEISRFVLALKVALAQTYQVPTMIFDEIDVGVGGTSLAVMAAKIARLSDYHQVILVTHSPQIACYADTHMVIKKMTTKTATKIEVESLEWQDRPFELARMLDGENYTSLTLQHAGEMLQNNRKKYQAANGPAS